MSGCRIDCLPEIELRGDNSFQLLLSSTNGSHGNISLLKSATYG